METSFKLNIQSDWTEIEKTRNKGTLFLKNHGLTDELIHSLIMILSELIENSIKYGDFEGVNVEISINLEIGKNLITIGVNNPVNQSTAAHLKKLDKTIQWIRGYQNSFQAYIEKLKVISKKPLEEDESGLGLVRIAYEGKAILDFFVLENMLNVSATYKKESIERGGIYE